MYKDTLVERILRKIIVFIVVASFVFPVMTQGVLAASKVSVTGGDNVKGGDTFTVKVTYDGGNIGHVNGSMSYDTDKLTYISGGSSSGNTGYIQLKQEGNGGSVTFNIKFQALTEGSTTVSVDTFEIYDTDENSLGNPSGSKTIKISGNVSDEQRITETRSSDVPVEETEPYGVDEIIEEENTISTTAVLLIASAIALVLIAIIAAVLINKRRKEKRIEKELAREKNRERLRRERRDD